MDRLRWHSQHLLLLSVCVATRAMAAAAGPAACDLAFLRTQAQQSVPEYAVDAVDVNRGIVSVLFASRQGGRRFAVALHASGTQLFTSVMGDGLDPAELARCSTPVVLWWQNSDRQRALAACSEMVSDEAAPDIANALRRSAQAALNRHDSEPQFWPMTLLTGGTWIAFAWIAFAVLLLIGRGSTPPSRTQQWMLFSLFAFAFLLRWLMCSGGPGDLRMNLAAAWSSSELELRWGPAPIALFRLLAMGLGDLRDTHILWSNLIVSSLLPIVLYAMLVELGVSGSAAVLAAFVAAAHPLLVAFSGVLGREPLYLFAAFGSILALLRYLKRGGAKALSAFALGTGLAVSCRPEGAHVLVVQLAILLLAPAGGHRRRRGAGVWVLLSLLSFAYLRYALEYGKGLAGLSLRVPSSHLLLTTAVLSPDFTPMAWAIAWPLGLVLGARRRAAWVAIAALLGLHIAWGSTGLYQMFAGYERQVASSRYELILLFPFVIGTALLIDIVLQARRSLILILGIVFAVLTAATIKRPIDVLLTPFTVDYEYRFLKRQALTLPPGSRLLVMEAPVDDIGFIDAPLVGRFVESTVRFEAWYPSDCSDATPGSSDTYLYIGSSCAPLVDLPNRPMKEDYAHWLEECALIRARVESSTVEVIEVPARKMSWHEFKEPTVRLGIYRMAPSTLCSTDSSLHVPQQH